MAIERFEYGGVEAEPPDCSGAEMAGQSVRVRGVVQGVGFRPFVATIARELGLSGMVRNDAEGVMIHVWGRQVQISKFITMLKRDMPLLAQVYAVEAEPLLMPCEHDGFEIAASSDGETRTGVAADAATCPACLDEIFDPENRRYRYPFTNCTHCGPRLSIIREVPYDRKNTSMSLFKMCPACQAEYDDQHDRRFHAQPNACPVCGPKLWLENSSGEVVAGDTHGDVISTAARWIQDGRIIAVKGVGGFHLACDATSETAVERLRERKKRYHKPFALMARDERQIRAYVTISNQERALLKSSESPVVLLSVRCDASDVVATGVAAGHDTLGFMLPYTPLHHLLMQALDTPIVLTSGNVSDEPQCIDNSDAKERLNKIADGYLLHDRDIVNRLDDSVVRMINGKPRLLRRARGYVPAALVLPEGFERADSVLAMGGELKNSFCMARHGQAVVSQHMGDLENAGTLRDYQQNLDLYRQLYDFDEKTVAVDMHPGYFSTQLGEKLAAQQERPLVKVQHHHAHIAACMAEHGVSLGEKVVGVALDGLGLGEDGNLRGGEFLLAGYVDCIRVGTIQSVAMIGGSKAIYEPWRNSYAHLHAIGWQQIQKCYANLDAIRYLADKPLKVIDKMIERGINSPLASSTGRLFDGVAALLGICREQAGFEGEAAMQLEVAANREFESETEAAYPVRVSDVEGLPTMIWEPMWIALLEDLQSGTARDRIAARFHHGLIRAVSDQAVKLAREYGVETIVLSGGVFQNRLLLEGVNQGVLQAGLRVLAPEQFPANDGGISLGQAVIAAAQGA